MSSNKNLENIRKNWDLWRVNMVILSINAPLILKFAISNVCYLTSIRISKFINARMINDPLVLTALNPNGLSKT